MASQRRRTDERGEVDFINFWFLNAGLYASANNTWFYQQNVFGFGFCLTLPLAKFLQLKL